MAGGDMTGGEAGGQAGTGRDDDWGDLTGKLLIAEPLMGDPNFDRSVVLILQHSEEGALGVVLNRPTDLGVDAVLDDWAGRAAEPPVVHLGGPVEQNCVIGLALRRDAGSATGWKQVVGDVGSVDLHLAPGEVGAGIGKIRFFAGYAGWGPGQLEGELDADAWLVVDALPADVTQPDPEAMWRGVLRRQEGRMSMLANFPDDPTMN